MAHSMLLGTKLKNKFTKLNDTLNMNGKTYI